VIEISKVDDGFGRWDELLKLICEAFAYMDGVIDPPSSAHALTLENLRQKANDEVCFVARDENGKLLGCIFCKTEPATLYIGKLAVSPLAQGKGVGAALCAVAEQTAQQLGLKALRLQTRIELVDNHGTFGRWGFVKTAERSHAGYQRITYIEMQKPLF
jgi:predicted N-acetyltransferase YhbS